MIKQDIERGPYKTVDEFVERAVFLLHEQEAWLAEQGSEIRAKIEEGYASAQGGELMGNPGASTWPCMPQHMRHPARQSKPPLADRRDRILRRDRARRVPCQRRCAAFQWNYYAQYEIYRDSCVRSDPAARGAGVWPARTSVQLAARQRRDRAAGPRELSCGADLSPGREWRPHAGGCKGGAADNGLPDRYRRVEPGAAASRSNRQSAGIVPARACGGSQV